MAAVLTAVSPDARQQMLCRQHDVDLSSRLYGKPVRPHTYTQTASTLMPRAVSHPALPPIHSLVHYISREA